MKIVNGIFLAIGLALFVVLLLRLDYAEVARRLAAVGWFFLVAIAVVIGGLVTSTLAWRAVIDRTRSRASYGQLLTAFWFGHAVNYLTPGGTAGEVLRGTVLKGHVEGDELVASLISYNFFNTLAMAVFNLIGPVLCLLFLDLPGRVVYPILGVAFAVLVPLGLLHISLRFGAIKQLARVVGWLPLLRRFREPLERKAADIDAGIIAFTKRRKDFRRAAFWMIASRFVEPLEIFTILYCFIHTLSPAKLLVIAFVTHTCRQLLSWVITFVPGQFGFAEGGMTLLYKLLGLDPLVGFAVELVRRLRQVVILAIGLVLGFFAVRASGGGSVDEAETDSASEAGSAPEAGAAASES